jgi:biopolymer transport protein ExbD
LFFHSRITRAKPSRSRAQVSLVRVQGGPVRFSRDNKHRRMSVELNVTSFVDIIFNLLVFFILSTSFSTGATSAGLVVDLPAAAAPDRQVDTSDLVVALLKEGPIVVRGKQVALDLVESEVREWHQHTQNGMVILQADAEVPHGRVVELMDRVKASGVPRVVIATHQ